MYISIYGAIALATSAIASAATTTTKKASTTSASILAVSSPTFLPNFTTPEGVNTGYLSSPINITDSLSKETLDMKVYPEPWTSPSTTHAEVKAAYAAIDWSKVPKAPIRKSNSAGDLILSSDDDNDSYCWWSNTNCVKPKASYLPEDVYYCPRTGDWGLNFDDGPYNPSDEDKILNEYSEPRLYNFLAEHNDQKATLFYIGSNVATYPAAARRALNDGHVLCVHTWSHPQMTTQSNIKVVAELYWTLRAIKEATGVTPKCWRPPYGDVDDRVRAIAWQMGMKTMIWDRDTNDWNMPGDGGGNLSPKTVDGYFQDWVDLRNNGSDNKQGHIVLEHELNNATVSMAEKWIPTLQKTFNLVSMHQCLNISQPYWEEQWVYPTEENPLSNATTTTTAAVISTAISSAASSTLSAAATTTASASETIAANANTADAATSTQILLNNNAKSGASKIATPFAFMMFMMAVALSC